MAGLTSLPFSSRTIISYRTLVTQPSSRRWVISPHTSLLPTYIYNQEEVTVVGRIATDSDTSSASNVKLNEASIVLESSRSMGSGARVPLKFDVNIRIRHGRPGCGGFGLFPGAIVALRGRNGGGGWFLVSELLTVSHYCSCWTHADICEATSSA